MKKFLIYAGMLTAMICWAMSFIWYKQVYLYFPPITTIFIRLILSSVLLFLISWAMGLIRKVSTRSLGNIALLALFEPFFYFVGESHGMQLVSSTVAAVTISIIPLLVPFAAYYFLKERVSWMNIVGIIVSFCGVILVILDGEMSLSASPRGMAYMSIAVIAAVFYTVLLKRLASDYPVIPLIAWQNAFGALYFLPLYLWMDHGTISFETIPTIAYIPIIKLSVFASSLAFILFTYGIREIGAIKTNIFTNTIPVFTAVFSYYILGDKLLFHNILGIFVVFGGLLMTQLQPARYHKAIMARVNSKKNKP